MVPDSCVVRMVEYPTDGKMTILHVGEPGGPLVGIIQNPGKKKREYKGPRTSGDKVVRLQCDDGETSKLIAMGRLSYRQTWVMVETEQEKTHRESSQQPCTVSGCTTLTEGTAHNCSHCRGRVHISAQNNHCFHWQEYSQIINQTMN